MMHASKVLPSGSYDQARVVDHVELDFDDRRKRRAAMTGQKGTEFLVDLADAPALGDGDGYELETGGIIAVIALPERLVEFRSSNPHVLTRVAWHLGNRHTPTQLLEGALRVRDDYVLVEMVKKLGADVGFVQAPFQPEGGAYGHGSVSGHDHHDHDHAGHKHDHDHDHDHNHDHAAVTADASEEQRLMAEAIARREARRAARVTQVHVHGPDCGHDHHDHGHHDHADHYAHDHGHDHAAHDHDHKHADNHGHDHHDHHHHDHDHKHGTEPKTHDHA